MKLPGTVIATSASHLVLSAKVTNRTAHGASGIRLQYPKYAKELLIKSKHAKPIRNLVARHQLCLSANRATETIRIKL